MTLTRETIKSLLEKRTGQYMAARARTLTDADGRRCAHTILNMDGYPADKVTRRIFIFRRGC